MDLLAIVDVIFLDFEVVFSLVVSIPDLILFSEQCSNLDTDFIDLSSNLVSLSLDIGLALLDGLHLFSQLLELLVLFFQDIFDILELRIKTIFLLG